MSDPTIEDSPRTPCAPNEHEWEYTPERSKGMGSMGKMTMKKWTCRKCKTTTIDAPNFDPKS